MPRQTVRIMGFNLLLLLLLAGACYAFKGNGQEAGLGYVISMAFGLAALMLGNLLALLATSGKQRKGFGMSMLLILLIGFGLCAVGSA